MTFKLPFFVAEISANHCGNLKTAKKLIFSAKKYGADAVKIQTYKPDTMTVNSRKNIFKVKKGIWKNYYLWDLYQKAHTPYKWHSELFNYAKKLKILIFSTPFDASAVDLLEKLHCPIYKVASFEITDLPLIKRIAKTKKPMIISTGMANLSEIGEAVRTARKNGCTNLTLLYCVSNYPSRISDFNLNNIKILKKKFKCKVGLSDHSKDNIVAISAVAAGAELIEKHIGLNKNSKGLDMEFSICGKDIYKFKSDIVTAKKLIGEPKFFRNPSEKKNKTYRRSIFVIKDIEKNEKFTYQNIKILRPAFGILPKYYEKIIGKKSKVKLKKNTPLKLKNYD
tara:strand:- start:1709 stop:2722 length:1014 start_codon:yes stop_codon:yes gene_type:complete